MSNEKILTNQEVTARLCDDLGLEQASRDELHTIATAVLNNKQRSYEEAVLARFYLDSLALLKDKVRKNPLVELYSIRAQKVIPEYYLVVIGSPYWEIARRYYSPTKSGDKNYTYERAILDIQMTAGVVSEADDEYKISRRIAEDVLKRHKASVMPFT